MPVDSRMEGSPPLTRGKGRKLQPAQARSGITPAYAGKREILGLRTVDFEDHPRLRGEKLHRVQAASEPGGSPPLTRGKGVGDGNGGVHARITPAYAGKSWGSTVRSATAPDHPRLRGEKKDGWHEREGFLGSPPLTRGKVCDI